MQEFQDLLESYEDEEEMKRTYPSLKHVLALKYKQLKMENDKANGSNEGDDQKFGLHHNQSSQNITS